MITINNLHKFYSDAFKLEIPNLKIENNEIIGIVGNNGAGKTTLLRLILDLAKADKGIITSKGSNVAKYENWKFYTGSFLDKNFLIDFLTPKEYLDFVAKTYKVSPERYSNALEKISPFLGSLLKSKNYIRELSAGNQQKVGITAAMIINPEVLILDEPFNNLDPTSQIRLKNLLLDFNHHSNTTIIISSHNLKQISEICSRIVILENGKILCDSPNNEQMSIKLETYFTPQ